MQVTFKVSYLDNELTFKGELIKKGSTYSTIKYLNNNGLETTTQILNKKICIIE